LVDDVGVPGAGTRKSHVTPRQGDAPDSGRAAQGIEAAQGLELWWLGQAGFRLRAPEGRPVVFIDPFLSRLWVRSWQAPVGPEALAAADAVLVTHEHLDHFDRPALRAAATLPGSRFRLVVPYPLIEEAVHLGISRERVIGASPDEALEVSGAWIQPVRALHGVNVSDAYSFGEERSGGRVRYLSYAVEIGGVRVFHAGDGLVYQGQATSLRTLRPQVALLPINGRGRLRERLLNVVGNMDERQAARLAHDMGARVLVPMHWEMFFFNPGSPRRLETYAARAFPDLQVLTLGRGAPPILIPAVERQG
jgi:L-ascorbate metabolism protein UlaG (beta-lactamase superfamily)